MGNTLNLPSVDGHFWIERDGKIIDWVFIPFNEKLSEYYGASDRAIYLKAPEDTQKILIELYKRRAMKALGTTTWKDTLQMFYEKHPEHHQPKQACCFENCMIELYKNGGELRFGSWGLLLEDRNSQKCPCGKCDGVREHWEFGGASYKTSRDFLN